MSVLVGTDVGGTFTDLVAIDERTGAMHVAKVPTTHEDQSVGLVAGLDSLRMDVGDATILHGTTVATNALLERKGATCGLITTLGFRDVLELRRRDRPDVYGLTVPAFEPLIPRERRTEVRERTRADGSIACAVDRSEVVAVAKRLVAMGCRVIVVSFLHSYANSANEDAARAVIEGECPEVDVVVGSEVVGEWREFERTSSAVAEGYIRPAVSEYLSSLEDRLGAAGAREEILVLQSNGGLMTSSVARSNPINTVLSGPAGGVIAAARYGRDMGWGDLISLDMGGTSADVSLVRAGAPAVRDQTDLDFGIALRVRMVDVRAIGAGGGSIAYIDRGGVMQVGPASAGAYPGPASYGRGGVDPTVSDANLVLGWLDADHDLGVGRGIHLNVGPARKAIEERIARPLDLTVEEAAEAIVAVVNARMVEQIRLMTVRQGVDPRELVLVAFGGAGPLHAGAVMADAGMAQALVPAYPGITSAFGCAIADIRYEFVQTVNRLLDNIVSEEFSQVLADQVTAGRARMVGHGAPMLDEIVSHSADMQYEGQTHTLRIPVAADGLSPGTLYSTFEQAYAEAFHGLVADRAVRLVNLRTTYRAVRTAVPLPRIASERGGESVDAALLGSRVVRAAGAEHVCAVYARDALVRGMRFSGPAVVVQGDTTTAVAPDMHVEVDELGNLRLMGAGV